jgi:hypothetical protein
MKKYLILFLSIVAIPVCAQESASSENKDTRIALRSSAAKPGKYTPLFVIMAEDMELRLKSARVDSSKAEEALNEIDPNWIRLMTVLKDKAAVDTYGAAGESGVIVIELKEGVLQKMPIRLREKFKVR